MRTDLLRKEWPNCVSRIFHVRRAKIISAGCFAAPYWRIIRYSRCTSSLRILIRKSPINWASIINRQIEYKLNKKMTAKLENKPTSIASVPDYYQTAIFLNPLISRCTLPLSTVYVIMSVRKTKGFLLPPVPRKLVRLQKTSFSPSSLLVFLL